MQIKKTIWPAVVVFLMMAATAIAEHLQGRLWKCACPDFLWTSDAWSPKTSQLFLDPYSFTHILHGLAFAGLITLLIRRMSLSWRFVLAMAIECVWEAVENSNTIIQRYREATASLGYQGDTVLNSMGDIISCAFGFALAVKLGWRWSIVLFFAVETLLLLWIHDSLILEILMLIHPMNSIKAWQLGR